MLIKGSWGVKLIIANEREILVRPNSTYQRGKLGYVCGFRILGRGVYCGSCKVENWVQTLRNRCWGEQAQQCEVFTQVWGKELLLLIRPQVHTPATGEVASNSSQSLSSNTGIGNWVVFGYKRHDYFFIFSLQVLIFILDASSFPHVLQGSFHFGYLDLCLPLYVRGKTRKYPMFLKSPDHEGWYWTWENSSHPNIWNFELVSERLWIREFSLLKGKPIQCKWKIHMEIKLLNH